jgi:hypothetical protein
MGGSTQVIPTTSNTQQKVEIPQYLQEAGQTAVAKATDYSNTPFQGFGGQTVAPLSQNQRTASTMANGSTNAGMAFLDQARGNLATGTGALGQAGTVANAGAGAGMGSANTGAALAHLAGVGAANDNNAGFDSSNLATMLSRLSGRTAAGSLNAGRPQADQGASLASLSGQTAAGSVNAGLPQAQQGADLTSLAGYRAAASGNAGAPDLADARRYNAMSAAPVSGSDVAGYFNPFIQTALNPIIANLTRSSAATDAGIRSKAGMSGSFGGSRMGLQQGQNNADLLRQIATTSGDMYSQGYDKALAAGQADRGRQGQAAGTSVSIGAGANTGANDAISRLIQASEASGRAGTTLSDLATAGVSRLNSSSDALNRSGTTLSGLATEGVNRLNTSSDTANRAAATRSTLANDNVSRLTQAAGASTAAGRGQSDLTDASLQRFLALIQPSTTMAGANRDMAGAESGLYNDAINRLNTTGQVEQTYNQDVDNADYQQYINQQQYALQQLNALIAAAGGTPYGTSTVSNTQGTQVVQKPSMLGQLAGLAMAGASMAAGSNRDWKENFAPVDDEDVLARFRGHARGRIRL